MKPGILLAVIFLGLGTVRGSAIVLRIGYFPNVTHAQGVIGSNGTRHAHGWFEQRLGPDVVLQWYPFSAGPSAMEAIFARSIDLAYVGPNPALNAYIRSGGDEIRVLAGAAEGGAALVVQGDGRIARPGDFKGLRVATPQLGNTQDVAARSWLQRQGFRISITGGDVTVLPIANPDQLTLFREGRIDAAWTVEPWVSRLETQAGGRVFLEQADAITTVLVSSVALLREHPALAARFRAAHVELTAWINSHPDEAMAEVCAGLSADTGRAMPAALVASSWRRIRFTDHVDPARFAALVADAQSVGFLRDAIPLNRLFLATP